MSESTRPKDSLAEQFRRAELIFTGSSDPRVLAVMSNYGYPTTVVKTAEPLFSKSRTLISE